VRVCGRDVDVRGRLIRIARLAGDGYEFVDDDAPAALRSLGTTGSRVDLFTFTQQLPDSTPRHAYPMEWDNVAALRVSSFEHWWAHQIGPKVRNMVRLAEKKGVTIREVAFDDGLVRGMAAIYDESPVRQRRRFAHYGKPLETVRRANSTFLDRSVFLGAFLGVELVGFAKLVMAERQAGLMQFLTSIRHRDKALSNALIAQAVRSCAQRAIPYLVYSQYSYGRKPPDGLSGFKERHGFDRIDVPRYWVSLTSLGRLALHLGLHHDLVARVPEPVLAGLRTLRTVWYARRMQAGQAS
jgi:hypothetical protein